MNVVLVKDIRNIGNLGDVVTVSRGYGVHYLIANNLALHATKRNIDNINQKKDFLKKQNEDEISRVSLLSKEIQGKVIKLVMQASKDGKLFGSINAKKIASEVSKLVSRKITHSNINLNQPIKYTGEYDVEIVLGSNVTSLIKLVIGESDSAIEKMLAQKLHKAKKES